jgi:hypothetical protein
MKKIMMAAALIFALAACTSFAQAIDPCPPDEFGVEATCLPLPPTPEAHWKSYERVIKLSEHCYAVVKYCRQWVCRGVAGLSRSRISISSIFYFNDMGKGNGTGVGEGCYDDVTFDQNDPNWRQHLQERIEEIIRKGIEQDVWLNDGRPDPCSTHPTDRLFEVMHGICVEQGGWTGTVNLHDGRGDLPFLGVTINFCEGNVACQNEYIACTDDLTGEINMTRVATNIIDASGNPVPPPYSNYCSGRPSEGYNREFEIKGVGNPIYGGIGVAPAPGDSYETVYTLGPTFSFNTSWYSVAPCTFQCGGREW